MRTLPILPAIALGALAFASGCGQVKGEPEPTGTNQATLHRSRDCNELVGDLRGDTSAKINTQIDAMISAIRDCRAALGNDSEMCNYYLGGGYGYSEDDSASGPPRADSGTGGSSSGGNGAPTSGSGNESGGGDSLGGTPSYSGTNTQVQGVDEADIVKTDGQRLFVLHGSTFRIVQASDLSELGTTTIEGTPTEMYVENGVAVIYSQVDGTPIYAASGTSPRNQGLDGQGNGSSPVAPGGDYPGYYSEPLTKITVLRIAGDFSTSIAKETYLEGSYLSSRRVGDRVRTVLQGAGGYDLPSQIMSRAAEELGLNQYPIDDVLGSLERIRTAALAKVGQLGIERWLPRTFDRSGDTVTAAPLACENTYTPTRGTTQEGLTQISTLDLGNLQADTKEIGIFGQASTVYGNAGSLYIAGTGYTNVPFGGGWGGAVPTDSNAGSGATSSSGGDATEPAPPPPEPRSGNVGLRDEARRTISRPALPEVISLNSTHLHKFAFDADGGPIYIGSGSVEGEVKNQFSLDERQDILRIATTERRAYRSDYEGGFDGTDTRPRSLTHVFALETVDGALVQKGAVKDLAPDEQIYSARFVGSKAYVVTFRQVDPLFVLDFANPAAPTKLGELKIPGFSEYMHPLDDNHLLTIGKNADANGRVLGLALQIFDVTNPTQPIQAHKYEYGIDTYGSSEASYNHKAFTYFAEKGLLSFPYTSYDQNNGTQKSTLELFRVGSETGFARLGDIDHSAFFTQQQNGCYYADPSVRRGLFIGDTAYSFSLGGIIAKPLSDLAGAGQSLALPSPYPNGGSCGATDGGGAERPEGN